MKKVIFLSLLLVMSLSVANAVQRAKPSSEQIKKLIKKMLIETKITTFAGINSAKDVKCKNIKIKKINILKIGKTSSNYYINSGSNVSSDFKVKFSIQGSCNLTSTFRVNPSEYDKYSRTLQRYNKIYEDGTHHGKKPTPVMPMDLNGRVPFRNNIPFEVYISTNTYGDWYASKAPNSFNVEDRHYSDKTEKYLKDLFYRKHGAAVKTWGKEQALVKSKMSYEAETGLKIIQFNRLYTPEVKALLLSQPKNTREFVFSTYWKLADRGNSAKKNQFLREVITKMNLKVVKSKSPKNLVNSSSNNSHSHGGRRHSHKLPTQGKSHRHRNGPIGR